MQLVSRLVSQRFFFKKFEFHDRGCHTMQRFLQLVSQSQWRLGSILNSELVLAAEQKYGETSCKRDVVQYDVQ